MSEEMVEQPYCRIRVALRLPVAGAIDELRLVLDDLAVLILANDCSLGSDVYLGRERVVPLDEVGDRSCSGGDVPLVLWIILATAPPVRWLHLTLEPRVEAQVQRVEGVGLVLGQVLPILSHMIS